MIIRGRVWKFGDEINTDLIFPHTAFGVSPEEQCRLCMSDNRPGWSSLVKEGDILIAGQNLGTGSSRPGALVLKRLGIRCLVAESFNGLFYRNSISYGLAAMAVPGVAELFEEGQEAEIDLSAGTVKNLSTGKQLEGNGLAQNMIDIISAGGIEAVLKEKGYFD